MTDHTQIKQLISAQLDCATTSEENKLITEHLNTCASCRQYAAELNNLSIVFKQWPDEDLSPDLQHKLGRALPQENSKGGRPMKPKSNLFKTTVGGGVLVTIIVGIFVLQMYSQRAIKVELRDGSVRDLIASGELAQYEPYYLKSNYEIKEEIANQPSTPRVDKIAKLDQKYSEVDMFAAGKSSTPKKIMPQSKKKTTYAKQEKRQRVQKGMQVAEYDAQLLRGEDRIAGFRSVDGVPTDSFVASIMPYPQENFNTEQYSHISENQFLEVTENPLSTFSIDVDTASYSNVRRFLNSGQMPPEDAVRIEEMINYFTYDYPEPDGKDPFSITTNAAVCPWNTEHQLVRIGLQGKTLQSESVPPSNLVFLMDVSGSMNSANKLPLLKNAFKMMVNQLSGKERVAIVVYAGAAGIVLESTPGDNKHKILAAIDQLSAGGSTAGGAGIQLAYTIAKTNFIKGGNNRVILATDGDFNVGMSSDGELVRLIEEKRQDGIFLTVLGFGTGNYKDAKMEQLANKGNGNFYYIDNQKEARKVMISELGSTLFTIAKDVKLQIEFNPAQIKAYRLVGYENRMLAKEDFNDDTKDAGELGAGHSVTALYEIVPADSEEEFKVIDDLVYQKRERIASNDLMTVKLRYKEPDANKSKLLKQTITQSDLTEAPKGDFQFASAVAEFGLILRNSTFKSKATYEQALQNAQASKGKDAYGYRQEFINLIQKAQTLDTRPNTPGIIFKGQ